MSIWRIEIGLNKPWAWGVFKSQCDCHFLDLGPLWFTWLSNECNRPLDN
jgi:hypothetical protein